MSNGRVEPRLQPDRETGDQPKGQEEPRIGNEVFVLNDLLTKWERDYFKLKLVKDVVKVTCLVDLEIGEYNQAIENCAREIETQEINKAKESGKPKPNVNTESFRRAVDVRLQRDYKERIENRLNKIYQLRKGER
jgi:hypothetical protein